jgi:hypothetical protein
LKTCSRCPLPPRPTSSLPPTKIVAANVARRTPQALQITACLFGIFAEDVETVLMNRTAYAKSYTVLSFPCNVYAIRVSSC